MKGSKDSCELVCVVGVEKSVVARGGRAHALMSEMAGRRKRIAGGGERGDAAQKLMVIPG